MIKAAALLLCVTALAGCQAPGPEVWNKDGVRVFVHEIRRIDNGYADYRIEVTDGSKHFCFSSGALGSPSQRRRSFADVQEQCGYILVPASCGGGNASKCRGWQVFTRNGPWLSGLKWIGYFTGRSDGERPIVCKDGLLYDTGDWLEINDLLSHAESPRYAVAYTDAVEDGLVFMPKQTWDLNAERFAAAGDDAPGLLFKAGLALLCGRPAELKAVRAEAERRLNNEGRKRFASSLQQVPLKDVQPKPFIPVGECPPETKP